MTEEQLKDIIRRAQAKDADAFDEIVDHYGPRLFGFLYRLTGSRIESEDLLQELFLRVVRGIDRYRHGDKFDGWLFRIATNLVRDRIRRIQRRPEHLSIHGAGDGGGDQEKAPMVLPDWSAPSPGESAERREDVDRLQVALERLPPAEREVVMLRHFSQLSFVEIAGAMGTPLGTALARAHRGLLKLRALMGASA